MKLAYCIHLPKLERNLAPILFLHSRYLMKDHFNHVGPQIADITGRKAYAVDFRDHGQSEWSDHFCIMKCVEDVEQFLLDHSLKKVVFVGDYEGGHVAMHVTLRKPDSVEMLIVSQMTVVPLEAYIIVDDSIRQIIELIPEDADEATARKLFVLYLTNLFPKGKLPRNPDKKLHRNIAPVRKNAAGKWEVTHNLDVIIRDVTHHCDCNSDYQGTYNGPSAFVGGPNKELISENDEKIIQKHFPKGVILRQRKFTTFLHASDPECFVDIVSKFINENTPSGPVPSSKY